MAYTRRVITDRVVQYPRRYNMTLVSGNTYDLTPVTGTVSAEGTAVNTLHLQPIENTLFMTNNIFTNTSASDSYTILITGVSSYTDLIGVPILVKFTVANTGTATLNVNSLGAKTILKNVSSTLETGDILANAILTLIYDGTNFKILSRLSNEVTGLIKQNITIPNTGWVSNVGDYVYKYNLAISGILSTDEVNVTILPDSLDVALSAELAPYVEEYAGGITFYAKSIPTESMSAKYTRLR